MADEIYSQAPFMVEEPETDFTALLDDRIRTEHEVPWLQYEISQAIEKGLHEEKPGLQYWLGYRDALMKVLNYPAQQVREAAEELALAAENRRKAEENARRIPAGAGLLRRLNPGYWRGEPARTRTRGD